MEVKVQSPPLTRVFEEPPPANALWRATARRAQRVRHWAVLGSAYAWLTLLAAVCIVPILWAVSASLHSNANLYSFPYSWLPRHLLFSNYSQGWAQSSFGRAMANSFIIAAVITGVSTVCGLMAGYGLAKFRFSGNHAIFVLIVSVLLVPFPAIMVPVFSLTRTLGLVNSYWGVIVPGVMSPLGAFLIRQYLLGLPDAFLDSARVDGAGELSIFWRIVVPLSWPVAAAVAVLTFVASWNNLLWPLIVINSERLYTVPLGLAQFNSVDFTDYVGIVAMSVIAVLPVIVLFMLARRRLLESIMLSGGGLVG